MNLDFKCEQCGNSYELPERMPQIIVECCNNVMCTVCVNNSLLPTNDGFICPFDEKAVYFSGHSTNAFPVESVMVTLLEQRCTNPKGKLSVKKSDQPMQNLIPLENIDQMKEIQPTPTLRGKCVKRSIRHESRISCFESLPSGELVSCTGNAIRIWNVKSGKCLKTLRGHTSLVLLPNGDLASGSNSTIKIWDFKNGISKHTLTGHSDVIICVQLLPTEQLASSSRDKTIKIWDLKTFSCTMTLAGDSSPTRVLQGLPTGELVSGSYGKRIKVWDLKTGECLKTLEGHEGWITSLLVLSSNTLVSGGYDGKIKVWEVKNGTCLKTITEQGNQDIVVSLALSQDGKMMVSYLNCGKIKIWNTSTWKCVMTFQGCRNSTGMGRVQFLRTGELVTSGDDLRIQIWR